MTSHLQAHLARMTKLHMFCCSMASAFRTVIDLDMHAVSLILFKVIKISLLTLIVVPITCALMPSSALGECCKLAKVLM